MDFRYRSNRSRYSLRILCLKFFYRIKPIIVKLPNNSRVIAEHAGTVQISYLFFSVWCLIHSWIYYNLVSAQRVIECLNCKLTFCRDLKTNLRVKVVYFKWYLNILLLKWKWHINREFSYSGLILKEPPSL